MLDQQIEAVYENGVFRPLQPVHLPKHQRVTLVLPREDEAAFDEDFGYQPLAFDEHKTIRVRYKTVGEFGPHHYPVTTDDLEQERHRFGFSARAGNWSKAIICRDAGFR